MLVKICGVFLGVHFGEHCTKYYGLVDDLVSEQLLLMEEIPFPTTWDGAKTPEIMGINYLSTG